MNIIICEHGKTIRKYLKKTSLINTYSPEQYKDTFVDILIIDESCEQDHFSLPGNLVAFDCFTPGTFFPSMLSSCKTHNIISYGMSSKDTITFSSINGRQCMICIQREISFIGNIYQPLEFQSTLCKGLNLYQNLLVGTIDYLLSDISKK